MAIASRSIRGKGAGTGRQVEGRVMKLLMAGAASLSALVLSGCGMLGENEGPPPESPAARAPAALPPVMTPAPAPSVTTPVAAPVPEDLPAVPADRVKCIPPWVAKQVTTGSVTETRCSPP